MSEKAGPGADAAEVQEAGALRRIVLGLYLLTMAAALLKCSLSLPLYRGPGVSPIVIGTSSEVRELGLQIERGPPCESPPTM